MRFFGLVGYGGGPVESPPGSGKWKEAIVERPYYGDVLRNTRQLKEGESVNDNLSVRNSISIVADQFANEHFHELKYVHWAGTRWKVSDVEVKSPRLVLQLGEVYNGPIPPEAP